MKGNTPRILLLVVIAALIAIFFASGLHHHLTLENFKAEQERFQGFYGEHRLLAMGLFMGIYIAVTALSLPGAAVMTLAGGALFGVWVGLILVSFASTIGATLAFLVSRFILREWVRTRFGEKIAPIDEGMKREGGFYLFTLRLVPIFPFFVINLVMGLTPISTPLFYGISQLGMVPGTFVYINAGTQLGRIDSLGGILSWEVMLSFALLGIFPLVAKKIVTQVRKRKILAGFPRPKRFDYNMVVIGAGSAGLVSAYIAAAVRAKVALIEKNEMGGDCLNTGCVPSKALIRSAKILSYIRRGKEFGLDGGTVSYDFSRVMERVRNIVEKVAPHDSVERYTGLGVECIKGEARVVSPWRVAVNGREITARSIIIATGASPFVPPIPGLDAVDYLTSDTVWNLKALPQRLVVLGGGPIGCELTQAFARLGSSVTQVEMAPRIMGREDPDVSELITRRFESEGVRVLAGHKAESVTVRDGEKILVCREGKETVEVPFDEILVAVGRAPNTRGFGLEELGVEIGRGGTVGSNSLLQTNFPSIYCAGDVAGPYQFTHTASHQAWYASVNALFGGIKSFDVDYRVIPWATYTDPEVARVGLSLTEAQEQSIPHEVSQFPMKEVDRAIADSEEHGFIRVLTRPGSDKILGVTIAGAHASDIIAEYILAMKHGIGLNKILGTIHIYPTLAELNRHAAGEWKKAHAPEMLLRQVERFLRWQRGGKGETR